MGCKSSKDTIEIKKDSDVIEDNKIFTGEDWQDQGAKDDDIAYYMLLMAEEKTPDVQF